MNASKYKGSQSRQSKVIRSDKNKVKALPRKKKSVLIPWKTSENVGISNTSPAHTPHRKIYKPSGVITKSSEIKYTKSIRLRKEKYKKVQKARRVRARRQIEKERDLITTKLNGPFPGGPEVKPNPLQSNQPLAGHSNLLSLLNFAFNNCGK